MKRIKILLVALIIIMVGIAFNKIYATDTTTETDVITRSLGAQMERPFTSAVYQYGVEGETPGSMLYYTAVKIYDSKDKNETSNQLLYTRPFYCVRGGKGFGQETENNTTDVSSEPINYIQDVDSEMHSNAGKIVYNEDKTQVIEKSGVIGKFYELYGINLDRQESFKSMDGTTRDDVNIYNAILWILDESYLPKDKINSENEVVYDASEHKTELLNKAGVPIAQQEDITDDDLEVIQQLAIWYFTNYDEQKAGTKPTVSQTTMYPGQFLTIGSSNNINSKREENLNRIYQYLIYGAIDNSSSYVTDEETGARTKNIVKSKFDETEELKITSVEKDSENEDLGLYKYYQIGPIKIANDVNLGTARNSVETTNIILCDAEGNKIPKWYPIYEQEETPNGVGEITHTGNHIIYRFVNDKGESVTKLQAGTEYYIRFYKAFEKNSQLLPAISEEYKYDVSKASLKISSAYTLSTATFLYAEQNSSENQAVVELDKEKVSEEDELTTKKFDLSLRKFITKINEIELNEENSRVPKVNTTTLINGIVNERTGEVEYTATYTHPKNALQVKTGDKVIYTIRIYNEGELDGTATEVTDYLPEGLEFVPATESEINTTYGWTTSTNNSKIIVTDYLKDKTIKAFNKTLTAETAGEGWQKAIEGDSGLYYADLQIECKVVAQISETDKSLRNIAAITEDTGDDIDSIPGDPGRNDYNPPENNSTYKEDDDDYENLILPGESFDLALRKYIIAVNGSTLSGEESRVPIIDIEPLAQLETTADYKHKKYPVVVENEDIITYRFTVYNESKIDGYVYSIVDYLPEGVEFSTESNTKFIEYKESYEEEELEGKEYIYRIQDNKITITPVNSEKLFELKAFDGTTLDYESIDVKFKVTANNSNENQVLTNVATMTYGPKDADKSITDRDSSQEDITVPTAEELLENLTGYKGNSSNKDDLNDSTNHYKGQQDDDDFEKIIIKGKPFDLALRKFITSVKRNNEEVEFEDRTPSIDTTTLINGTFDRNGQKEYTATYEHSKEPLVVKQGDIVTYTLRIYNEGDRAGYATEITDYIPEGLALILNYNTNFENGWKLQEDLDYDKQLMQLVGENGLYNSEEDVKNLSLEDFEGVESLKEVQLAKGKVTITSSMLQDELIKAYDKTLTEETAGEGWQKAENGEGGLYYKDIEVACLVIAENTCKDVLTNIAEISEDKDEYKQDVNDRDSTPDNVENKNEDDDDYEPIVLKYFDLALRKFITGVETNGKVDNITSRIPTPKMDKDGKIVYEHSKEPVYVANNDTVIYTIRVYNEGTIAGYAEEITDDIPQGLEYLPKHDVNKKYEWIMIDKDGNITENMQEAVKITTDYLSEEKEIKSKMTITDETTGEKVEQTDVRENLIKPFDSSKAISSKEPLNPDYRDVKVAFKVVEPNTSDRIIVNSAQISKDSGDDEDSIPDEWNEGEDDQDKEYIYVKYFDLSLLKWVTQTIVTVDGKTITTETGFEPNTGKTETTGIRENDETEPIAKVEIDRKKLKKTTVKFVYNIKVTNEGEIAGYATEITDYIPEGLEFLEEDNKAFGWEKSGNNKVTTRALETVLLKPGESATVKIVFTWKNNANNLGLKTNIAEISEDYNEHNSKDIDSEPDNKVKPYEKEQEDDDDFALVILSIKTGKGISYIILIISMLTLLATGMYLIKKYVLTY